MKWFMKSQKEVLKNLNVDENIGLTSDEAKSRLSKYGSNKLQGKKKKTVFQLFLGQLQDTLIYVLIAAALINIIVHWPHGWTDAIIILLVVFINAVIGVAQETKAEKALEALQQMTSPKSLVKRNGKVIEVDSTDLVIGDIVIIDAGRYIPADLRLISSVNLQIEESALTGESVPTEKKADYIADDEKLPIGDKINMAFMSTVATYGRGEGVVVATGMDTEIGKIAKILDEENENLTPLQIKLDQLGKMLGYGALIICAIMFLIGVFEGRPIVDMMMISISLAVAAIPEGLVAIVAIVLSIGVTRMSKINAIVRKLSAVETLGSVNIICSDKTGTLTQNKMTVVKMYTMNNLVEIPEIKEKTHITTENVDENQLIDSFILSSDAIIDGEKEIGDPTEIALIALGIKYGKNQNSLIEEYPRVGEKPFDSGRKLMSTLTKNGKNYQVHTKGAVDNILNISNKILVNGEIKDFSDDLKKEVLKVTEQLSDDALRVLGVGFKNVDEIIDENSMENDLVFIGLVGMIDPPRSEVKDSIKEAKKAGVTPVMITGDHKNTAFAIAKELEIAYNINQTITGAEIDMMSDEEFAQKISNYRVFARVSPEHKVKIVRAFKEKGNIVSMTGDGVNDAPSLKFSDIGVAMGITGTDVSKGASDIILMDDNFSTIVYAIEEGRNIYNNIKKTIIFLLSCNLGEVIAIFFATVMNLPIPLLATQLLWVNLVTDTLPAICLGIDNGDKNVMNQAPRDPNESFFAEGAGVKALIAGINIGLLTLFAFVFGAREITGTWFVWTDESVLYGRTMAFIVLTFSQLFYSLSMRNNYKTIFEVGFFKNKYLILAIFIGLVLQIGLISINPIANVFGVTKMNATHWGEVILISIIPMIVHELIKIIVRKVKK